MWHRHECFANMGTHFFTWNHNANEDCKNSFPVQLIYHKGELNGFVWQHFAELEGDRWEHHPKSALGQILVNPPTCVYDALKSVGLSFMHIYVKDHLLLC